MARKDLDVLRDAVWECRRLVDEYRRSEKVNVLLVERLVGLKDSLVDDFLVLEKGFKGVKRSVKARSGKSSVGPGLVSGGAGDKPGGLTGVKPGGRR